ncbi:MAG: RibD family protein [Roseofilum sp. SBFL]|uniref:RibD family protein n=1 Tax=unclassified Roseofilum TaxID=2620099 RepID=UPI001B200827|nr:MULTISPECIES: RibD family protein [unclassified Roseofilum]MBP0012899.1 RibD family protein [Roseofilum sp. SID3]MBP0026586.1 RibD family protein [Roseofilum sp. SID2]MBP0037363.1 RibD family protein [Roseofilum sp. SID1]MBP0040764.1 RibD family protein [Roseofilum sp. SBFL]
MTGFAVDRPHITAILAMSADGKISDIDRSPARFGSTADKAHLEQQIAKVDAVLFGAGTLRAYGTTLSISDLQLLQQRQQQQEPPQPVQIVVSQTGNLDVSYRFFQQSVPRWLLTTPEGAIPWQNQPELAPQFDRILTAPTHEGGFYWNGIFVQFAQLHLKRLAILGGGALVASLLAGDWIDELWLTVCPVLLGGATAPTPVDGLGLSVPKSLTLLSAHPVGQEVFLHYQLN